jgi:hypothetical protein
MPILAILCCVVAPDKESDPCPGVCGSCGSPNVIAVEWHGPSGVVAPDGGEECRMQCGIKCLNCGQIEQE